MRWLLVAALTLAILAGAVWLNPINPGLRAQYYRGTTASGDPAHVGVQQTISVQSILEAWNDRPPESFSAAWSGSLLALRGGSYTFETISDDGSWLYVDGQRVIDNGGQHGSQPAIVSLTLSRGVHAVRVEYTQLGGRMDVRWRWSRAGGALQDVPAWLLTPRREAFWPFATSVALQRLLFLCEWLWMALALGVLARVAWQRVFALAPWLRSLNAWPALPLIVLASAILNGVALWWGLPLGYWPPDELTPKDIAVALAQHFSHGWFGRYPPLHFYVLALAQAPAWLLEVGGLLRPGGVAGETLRAVLGRLVSLAAGIGSLWLLFLCAVRLFGNRTALLATAQFAMIAPFVYYAKTANLDVPYLFWFALAFWFLLRLLDDLRVADFIGFAAAATCSICTKDQAYGLFALPSLLILQRLFVAHRQSGRSWPLLRALVDRRLLIGAAFAAALFAASHNVFFNWPGFLAHVSIIVGSASQGYRMFPSTLAGEQALLSLTIGIVRTALGWPLLVLFSGGFLLAWWRRDTRRAALLATLPCLSYYLTFIAVVGYNYDRFLLPVFFLLSMFGGLLVDRWLALDRFRSVHLAVAGAALVYTLCYVVSIDILMLGDSRYTVERYLASTVRGVDDIGFVFPSLYSPRLGAFSNGEITSVQQLQWEQPRWFVLNMDYGSTEPAPTSIGRLIRGLQAGTLGYRPVYRARTPAPFAWLPAPHRDLTGTREDGAADVTSSLRHINPTFVVFERER